MWKKIISCFLCVSVSVPATVNAVGPFKPTEAELRLLPSYCRPKAGAITGKSETVKRWFRVFGPDYKHMHHYCQGLVSINRGDNSVTEASKHNREFHYKRAISEFTATADKYATKTFKLWPELYVKRGDAYGRLKDYVNAELDYLKAYKKYPKYPLAYKKLVDLYIKQGRIKEAREINDAALERFKKKKSFLKRAKKLKNL